MKHIKLGKRSYLFISLMIAVLLLTACGKVTGSNATSKELRIGYQKNGTTLMLKQKKQLEKDLEESGYKVTWSEFNTGSSILEALNAGSIDIAGAGDIPSIFALSKGSDFKYIASEPSSPKTEGILVSKDSSIKSLKDLKGKKIAFNKASIAQYLLNQALASVGLTLNDIEPMYLNPPDASIAFEQGQVDAWVVWDPYMTVSESKGNIILQDAQGIVPLRSFYFSSSKLAEKNPEIVEKIVQHIADTGNGINENPTEAATLLEKETNIPHATWEKVLGRKKSDVHFMDQQAVNDLQAEADDLLKLKLIDQEVKIAEHVWDPEKKK
ncbi:aliphatic sulfonate ABC transporter substrate-binding protein [Peribacillus huizhouensis]|uniref:Sulfonate transport system substrate-binding protein n=1 Tax=Peribacillus huizhouensis TaxID=1501239 RepID=A0ABR6CLK4_9BACI|nr:aliphatic sulfonate ABC transporter substrate-binding protein [Peribacillus huizhouensis]MBA9025924.1 sulfonate transport system substrate-binding protein [Peribacillus huizhouensis]